MLVKETFAVQERHTHHRYAQISGGAQGVTGQYTQAATVCGHSRVKANLHGEIGNRRWLTWCLRVARNHEYSP
jgi:hypothetical protein